MVGLVVFMTLSQLLTEPQIVRAGEDLRTSVETVVPQSLATDKVACRCTWFGYVTFWEICNRSTAFRTRKIFSFFFSLELDFLLLLKNKKVLQCIFNFLLFNFCHAESSLQCVGFL